MKKKGKEKRNIRQAAAPVYQYTNTRATRRRRRRRRRDKGINYEMGMYETVTDAVSFHLRLDVLIIFGNLKHDAQPSPWI